MCLESKEGENRCKIYPLFCVKRRIKFIAITAADNKGDLSNNLTDVEQ